MTPHRLSRRDARRISVRAQLLASPRPADVLDVLRRLGGVQVDLTAAVAPSAELVFRTRLGNAYAQEDLDGLLVDRSAVEHRGILRPAEDIALYRAEMASWPGQGPLRDWQRDNAAWVAANERCRQDILQELRTEGPLPARELPDTCAVPWRSTGWTHHRNVMVLLQMMESRGEVAVSSRDNGERVWDLAERVYPDADVVPLDQARAERDRRRLQSLGLARSTGPEVPGEPMYVGEAGEPAVVDGVRGSWRVDPDQLGQPFRGRAALLSPLDRLVVDRRRVAELFSFDYQLEMYKPAAKRRWGYYALPILYGDRLVGKLDAAAERRDGVLRLNAVHEDAPFTATMRQAVVREVRGLADLLQLEVEPMENVAAPWRAILSLA